MLTDGLDRLGVDRHGSVAVVFGLSLVPLLIVAGGAIDYAAATGRRTSIQKALDAGVLASARNGKNNASYLQEIVNANLKAHGSSISNATLTTATGSDGALVYKADASFAVQTKFLTVIGLQSMPVGAHSEATIPGQIATATFTPTNTQGAYSKDIFLWTKNAAGAVTSKQTVLTYRYNSSDGSRVTTPPIGTQTITFTVPAHTTYGVGMVVYQDYLNYSGALINPVEFWSDASNTSTFVQQTGACSSSAGANNNWEDGGDSNFVDFVFNMKCTMGPGSNTVVRLTK